MNYSSRRLPTPVPSRKRKERETFYPSTSPKPLVPSFPASRPVSGPATTSSKEAESQPLSSNRLLAGYMAYEFLTNGTLLGKKFDPARPEPAPVNAAELKRNRLQILAQQSGSESGSSEKPKPPSYAEVANLLKSDGAHIPGVVNPSQLARWIQM